jgi:tetratricopeptide (TPR) repeat protein
MLRTLAIALTAATALTVSVPASYADELTAAYAEVLANPTSPELNLRYAQLAEQRGEFRKALAAYERVLVNDPTNAAARDGLQRVRRIIQPPDTQKIFEIGTTWQSNVLRNTMPTGDVLGYGSFRLRDERPGDRYRWRTNLNFYGEAYAHETEMNYAAINGDLGPIIDLKGTNWAVRPAVGVGTAWFDGRNYYRDVNATALFEGYLNGAYQWLRFRAGYRWYDPSFTTDAGSYVDITGRFSIQDVFHERDSLSVSPWIRWSHISGTADSFTDDFAAGLYTEAGANFEYAKRFNDAFAASINVRIANRVYEDIGTGSRNDWNVAPGASLIFSNLLGPQADLRFDYKYEWNRSNMPDHTWQNQSITAAIVVRR